MLERIIIKKIILKKEPKTVVEMVAQLGTVVVSNSGPVAGDGEYPGGCPEVMEMNNNCVRNPGVSLHGIEDDETVQYLNSRETPVQPLTEMSESGMMHNDAATGFLANLPDEQMEENTEKKKKRFRPAPEMQNSTMVDYVPEHLSIHSEPLGQYFKCHSQNLDISSRRAYTRGMWYSSWEWDDNLEMLADECGEKVLKARKCSSSGTKKNERPRQGNKSTRAQKQIAEKHFRSKNCLQNTGGNPTVTVLAKHGLISKNEARERHLADSIAAKKANIEKRLGSLKLQRKGPPRNLPVSSTSDGCPSTGQTQKAKPVKYELKEGDISQHASTEDEQQLLKCLLLIQGRDLLPEDYDLLLRLDDNVDKKTVSSSLLKSLRTKLVTLEDVTGDGENSELTGAICTVCMEPYSVDESVKWLPCEHVFS